MTRLTPPCTPIRARSCRLLLMDALIHPSQQSMDLQAETSLQRYPLTCPGDEAEASIHLYNSDHSGPTKVKGHGTAASDQSTGIPTCLPLMCIQSRGLAFSHHVHLGCHEIKAFHLVQISSSQGHPVLWYIWHSIMLPHKRQAMSAHCGLGLTTPVEHPCSSCYIPFQSGMGRASSSGAS